MTTSTVQVDWLSQLDESFAQTLARTDDSNGVGRDALISLADLEAFAALNLEPMPTSAIAHLEAGYAKTRPYLERLTGHAPAVIVSVSARDGYVYPLTPRKILRRVLDHALDHLNQLEQWLDWQARGVVPEPTDGWATADTTFAEDTAVLTDAELSAWLWRIDRSMALFSHRAALLTQAQLDWTPPDGGWSLERILHHAARSYGYAVWLDEALPEDARARYGEAHRRLRKRVSAVVSTPPLETLAFYGNAGVPFGLAATLQEVLAAEQELRTTGRLLPISSELD